MRLGAGCWKCRTHHAASSTAASQGEQLEVLTFAKEQLPAHATQVHEDQRQAQRDGAPDQAYFQDRNPACCQFYEQAGEREDEGCKERTCQPRVPDHPAAADSGPSQVTCS